MFTEDTRVLVVDDMSMMRSMVKAQLRAIKITTCLEAEHGERALEILQEQYQNNSPVQLILSDWNMPLLSGVDLLRKVRAMPKFHDLPFILITAEGEAEQIKEATDLGVSTYIRKPFTPSVFQAKLEIAWKRHHSS